MGSPEGISYVPETKIHCLVTKQAGKYSRWVGSVTFYQYGEW